MAASVAASTTAGASGLNTVSTGSVSNTSGNYFVAFATLWVDEANEMAISDTQTLTWTERIADTVADNNNQRVWTAPCNGTATTITVDSWTTASNISLIVVEVTGAAGTFAATASNHANGNTKQITTTITTNDTGALLLAAHASGGGSYDVLPTGFTLVAEITTLALNDAEMAVASKTAAGGTDNHTWGDNTTFLDERATVAIEVDPSAGGANTRRYTLTTLGVG